ncbi:ciliary microtubule inner protein 4 [Sorex fumeus]|uniref:ciliary microtubule inner protein 4 n=1 Tax=Sorex fumeus TaxID=62283 RepID=UPI0024ACCC1F|nr:ciliary microtubule inner protein 4 [Sorex fumeus]
MKEVESPDALELLGDLLDLSEVPRARVHGVGASGRPCRGGKEGRQDVEAWGRTCSPLDASKLKSPAPSSFLCGPGSGRDSPVGQTPPDQVSFPPSRASTCLNPGSDPQPEALKKGDHRPSSTESHPGSREGAQTCGGLAEEPGSPPVSQRPSVIPENIRHKFGSSIVDQMVSEKQAQKALSDALEGQKNANSRLGRPQGSVPGSPSYADYYDLGYHSRSNLFQGATQEAMSLMKASYTPEVIERSVRDIEHWHGRKTDDLGRWHQKNLMDMNLQKALDEKHEEKGRRSLKS